MKKLSRADTIMNACGAIGYMLLLTTWALFAAILLALVFGASYQPGATEVTQTVSPSSASESSAVLVAASYILTVVLVLVSIGIVMTLPYFVGKWGSRILRWLMRMTRIDITRRQLFFVKSILASLPLLGLLIVNFTLMPEEITLAAMYVATVSIGAVSITIFLLQLLLARRLNVPVEEVW